MNDPITQMQETLAHQDEEIRRLSDEVYAQQKELAQLKQQFALLQDKFRAALAEDNGMRSPDQETPPPHY